MKSSMRSSSIGSAADSTLTADRSLGVTSAAGFAAAGVACGIKDSGGRDLALVTGPAGTVAAGAFTTNVVAAAPVVWSRARLAAASGARAIVLNSGNANACTGSAGDEAVRRTADETAALLGCAPEDVLVCSTGVIGVSLPMDAVSKGLAAAAANLSDDGGHDAAEAIMTTDTVAKEAGVKLPEGVTFAGMAKGVAMLSPRLQVVGGARHATMLSVVTTDAVVDPADLRAACAEAVAGSFNEITVDLAQSTNDTVLVLASGAAGVRADAARAAAALRAVFDDLATQMLADAEGGTKVFTVSVGGAENYADAAAVARRVADSPLVKAAVYGGDPNWGRVLQAAGTAGVDFDPDATRLEVSGSGQPDPVLLVEGGAPVGADPVRAEAALRGPEVAFRLHLGGDGPWARVRASDLTPEYVRLNAEYTT
jgi:glutamate N-acetyltransferase/amino-acid N-acetyltransferase